MGQFASQPQDVEITEAISRCQSAIDIASIYVGDTARLHDQRRRHATPIRRSRKRDASSKRPTLIGLSR